MNIRALSAGDDGAVAAAEHLFDGPIDPAATARFLADPDHHLHVATTPTTGLSALSPASR
jgi:hypothetical protein